MKKFKKLLCLLLAAACITSFIAFNAAAVSQDELDALEDKQSELEEEQEELDKAMEEAKKQIEDKEAYLETIRAKMDSVEQEIDTMREKIQLYEEEIETLNAEIASNEQEIEDDYEVLRSRLNAIYKSGNASSLEIILGAKDFNDFVDKSVIVEAVGRFDKNLIDGLNNSINEKNTLIEETQKAKDEVTKTKQEQEAKLDELAQLETEGKAVIEELRTQVDGYEEREAAVAAEKDQLMDEIAKWHEEYVKEQEEQKKEEENSSSGGSSDGDSSSGGSSSGGSSEGGSSSGGSSDGGSSSGEPTGGSYLWPAPGCTVITSYWGDGRAHQGLDIACYGSAYGKPIVAAESGTVIRANKTDEWGSGWGYHIMIDHGSGYATQYAHCSQVLVDVGDYVERGQLIGYIGNTGNSFGAHLHFECWYNGVRYDPAPTLGL